MSPLASPLLVIGLGNPGPQYAATRHNIGAMVIDELADQLGVSLSVNRKLNSRVAEARSGVQGGGHRVVLAIPRSAMNLSGGPVKALASYYRADPSQVLVIHDELDLDLGDIRYRIGGGLNGHNGLRDIAKSLGTRDFPRIRVGIGRPPGRMAPASYVLRPFSRPEQADVAVVCADAADLVVGVADGSVTP